MDEEERLAFRDFANNHRLMEQGTRITASEAALLSKEIRAHELNREARLKLIGYFFAKMMYQFSRDGAVQRQKHLLWMIDNLADSELCSSPFLAFPIPDKYSKLYEEAKKHWMIQVSLSPRNTQLLKNAAMFFTYQELDAAEQLILQAISIEPDNLSLIEILDNVEVCRKIMASE